jgi:hypothetical protein
LFFFINNWGFALFTIEQLLPLLLRAPLRYGPKKYRGPSHFASSSPWALAILLGKCKAWFIVVSFVLSLVLFNQQLIILAIIFSFPQHALCLQTKLMVFA